MQAIMQQARVTVYTFTFLLVLLLLNSANYKILMWKISYFRSFHSILLTFFPHFSSNVIFFFIFVSFLTFCYCLSHDFYCICGTFPTMFFLIYY